MKGALVNRQRGVPDWQGRPPQRRSVQSRARSERTERRGAGAHSARCRHSFLTSLSLQRGHLRLWLGGLWRREHVGRSTARREQEPGEGGGMESGAQQGRVRASSSRTPGDAGKAAEPSQDGDALMLKKSMRPQAQSTCLEGVWLQPPRPSSRLCQAPPAGQLELRSDRVWPLPSRHSKILGWPRCQRPAWLGSALSGRRKAQQTLSRGLRRTPRRGGAVTRPGAEGDILMGGERDRRHRVSRTRMLSGGESPLIGSSCGRQ